MVGVCSVLSRITYHDHFDTSKRVVVGELASPALSIDGLRPAMPEIKHSFVAAGTAAAVELSLVQPLDVVKTRLHLADSKVATSDRFGGSTFRALRAIFHAEGMRGLWRGFGTGLAIVVPRRGLKFAANETIGALLERAGLAPRRRALLAGGLAGALEACVITPLEVLKVSMQTERTQRGATPTRLLAVCRAVSADGLAAWYSGLGATVAKHSIHSCVYFASYAELKASSLAPAAHATAAERVRFSAASGFVAGTCAGACNNPFDVLKSRQQVAAAAGVRGHELARDYASARATGLPRSMWARSELVGSMLQLVESEGVRVLWRGLGAKLLRLGPGSAIIFTVYEATLSRLARK